MPALTAALVTAAEPVAPVIGVGPAAARVHAVGTAVPPLSLVTVLTKVSVAGLSTLVNVQVAVSSGFNASSMTRGSPDTTSHTGRVESV